MRKLITLQLLFQCVIFFIGTNALASEKLSNQKMNLDASESERFILTEKIWPSEIGDAHVCLWNDDKYAAASITIDDNIENEHDWWLSLQKKYNFNATWFIILRDVTDWSKYQKLIDAGNEIQGHDDCDINNFEAVIYSTELAFTKSKINEELENNFCSTYAYPCGDASKLEQARQHYISMRGVVGLMNNANKINYLNLNSRSSTNDLHDVDILLDENEKLWNTSYNRGWFCTHYHSIASIKNETESFLAYLSSNSNNIWIGKYSEVAKYGQERDSHILRIDEKSNTTIKLTISDDMDDNHFDYPLTVKVRIDNTWNSLKISPQENGRIPEALIIEHEGNKFALIKAIPDRGQITITGSSNNLPVLDIINDQTIKEGSSLNIPINATDINEDQLYFELINQPTFLTLNDNTDGSGMLQASPDKEDAGLYKNIILNVTDKKDTVSISFSISVEKSTGLKQTMYENAFRLYPNIIEESTYLTIEINHKLEHPFTFDIVDQLGKKVFEKKMEPRNPPFSLNLIPPSLHGIFIARIYNQEIFSSEKLFFL